MKIRQIQKEAAGERFVYLFFSHSCFISLKSAGLHERKETRHQAIIVMTGWCQDCFHDALTEKTRPSLWSTLWMHSECLVNDCWYSERLVNNDICTNCKKMMFSPNHFFIESQWNWHATYKFQLWVLKETKKKHQPKQWGVIPDVIIRPRVTLIHS